MLSCGYDMESFAMGLVKSPSMDRDHLFPKPRHAHLCTDTVVEGESWGIGKAFTHVDLVNDAALMATPNARTERTVRSVDGKVDGNHCETAE